MSAKQERAPLVHPCYRAVIQKETLQVVVFKNSSQRLVQVVAEGFRVSDLDVVPVDRHKTRAPSHPSRLGRTGNRRSRQASTGENQGSLARPCVFARAPQPEPTDAGALANRRAWRFDDGMSNLLSTLRALIVGVPKASIEQPLPIVDSSLGFTPPPLAVTRRKYVRGPLKVRGGRARARAARAR